MNSLKNIADSIDFLIQNKFEFAIFRMPFSNTIRLFVDLKIKKESGFVLQGFKVDKPIEFIADDFVLENEDICIENLKDLIQISIIPKAGFSPSIYFMNQNSFENYVEDIIQNCRKNKLTKAVSARIKAIEKPDNFKEGAYFVRLLKNYDSAFLNLFYKANHGLWLGASPELLLKKNEQDYKTVSLAGTKLKAENRPWTKKEKEEQQIVTDYIENLLLKEGCILNNNLSAATIRAGQIEHIKTEINFASKKSFLQLAHILHPTPAVCGFSKNEALKLIRKHEGNQRKLYSGYLGVCTEEEKTVFVNLRCMQIDKKQFLVYVGAGITEHSIAEKEWQETENKAQTLMNFL